MLTRVCTVTMVICPLSTQCVLSTGLHDGMSYFIVGPFIMLHTHFTDENTQAERGPPSPETLLRMTAIRCGTYCEAVVASRCGPSPGRDTETRGAEGEPGGLLLPPQPLGSRWGLHLWLQLPLLLDPRISHLLASQTRPSGYPTSDANSARLQLNPVSLPRVPLQWVAPSPVRPA